MSGRIDPMLEQVPFMATVRAFAEIRNREAWREAGFDDFDSYCRGRWGLTGEFVEGVVDSFPALRDAGR